MTPTTAREIAAALSGAALAGIVMAVACIADHGPTPAPAPATTTVTTTVTTPVAPCHHEDCPPWPSLDQGDEDQ